MSKIAECQQTNLVRFGICSGRPTQISEYTNVYCPIGRIRVRRSAARAGLSDWGCKVDNRLVADASGFYEGLIACRELLDAPINPITVDGVIPLQQISSKKMKTVMITNPKFSKALTGMKRTVIQTPVHLLGLQSAVETLQQTKLGGSAIPDTNLRIQILDMRAEPPGDKRRPVKNIAVREPCVLLLSQRLLLVITTKTNPYYHSYNNSYEQEPCPA